MTNYSALKATLTALSLAAMIGLSGCGGGDAGGMSGMGQGSAAPHMSHMPSSPSSSSASASDSTGALFNGADVTFVRGMLPHHTQAVEMSDSLLKKSGIDPDTTALAQQVKAAQQPEITTMNGWLKAWGESADGGMGHGGMGGGGMGDDGMATDADMKELDRVEGASAEKTYLEMMTAHHRGAIKMAEAELKDGKNPDAVQLAREIASSQQAEIDTMKQLLAAL